jgi:hypothetical protein
MCSREPLRRPRCRLTRGTPRFRPTTILRERPVFSSSPSKVAFHRTEQCANKRNRSTVDRKRGPSVVRLPQVADLNDCTASPSDSPERAALGRTESFASANTRPLLEVRGQSAMAGNPTVARCRRSQRYLSTTVRKNPSSISPDLRLHLKDRIAMGPGKAALFSPHLSFDHLSVPKARKKAARMGRWLDRMTRIAVQRSGPFHREERRRSLLRASPTMTDSSPRSAEREFLTHEIDERLCSCRRKNS